MPDAVLLSGIVGSTAYGLAGPDSDVDRLGVFALPTERFLGLHPPPAKKLTRETKFPDSTMHEAAKFCSLALQCNPTAAEVVWLPDELIETRTPLGEELIGIREHFLSAPRVRSAYLGYATQQFERLSNRSRFPDVPVNRIAKHARHLLRLVEQGTELYTSGTLPIRVRDPKRVLAFGESVANGEIHMARSMLARAELTFDRCTSALPNEPDERPIEAWLQKVRREMWSQA